MKKLLLLTVSVLFLSSPVFAQAVAPLETPAKQAFLIDANTGTVLYAKDADQHMPTSSMSKMMTMYVVFDAIKNGKLKKEDMLQTSEHAWKQEGSRMFLNLGQSAKVEDLIRGVIIQSGNDAAVVFAEALGSGSESGFSTIMNNKARELGMTNSHFMNATGLPDPLHYSTAHDLAVLALALMRDFPDEYHYFSELEFTYNNIKQGNRNPLLYRNMNVDGLKTGHTDVGGFGITASAKREGRRLVVVLNGMETMQMRADESAHLLDWGYREYGFFTIAKANDVLGQATVWLGEAKAVPLVIASDLALTLPRTSRDQLTASVLFNQPVAAPIAKGQVLGKLTVKVAGVVVKEVPLIAAADVARLGFFDRFTFRLKQFFGHKDGG